MKRCLITPLRDEEEAVACTMALEPRALSISWFREDEGWSVEILVEDTLDDHIILALLGEKSAHCTFSFVEDVNWLQKTYQSFPPLHVGPFKIFGSHEQDKERFLKGSSSSCIPMEINAATAFGSGQHPSTQGCLLSMVEIAEGRKVSRALDLGCGSGILAIGLKKLGVRTVVGADNDLEAIRKSKEHALVNGSPDIFFYQSEGFTNPRVMELGPYDLVVANILASPLKELAPQIMEAISPGGLALLSGLTVAQKEEILEAYKAPGGRLVSAREIDGWSTLTVTRQTS